MVRPSIFKICNTAKHPSSESIPEAIFEQEARGVTHHHAQKAVDVWAAEGNLVAEATFPDPTSLGSGSVADPWRRQKQKQLDRAQWGQRAHKCRHCRPRKSLKVLQLRRNRCLM